jgi:hypothetical protein
LKLRGRWLLFIGHYALGLASKRFAPEASLGVLIAAPIFLDLLWPIFLLIGLEQVRIEPGRNPFTTLNFVSYPISHGLVATVAWATLFAVFYCGYSRYWRGAIVVWIGVVSHWFLDLIVHRPDLPLYAGGPRFGLGLWKSPAATVAIEAVMYAIGILIYARVTRERDAIGRWGFWSFVAALALVYVLSIFAPPPPSVKVLALVAMALGLLFIFWAWWLDQHREVR